MGGGRAVCLAIVIMLCTASISIMKHTCSGIIATGSSKRRRIHFVHASGLRDQSVKSPLLSYRFARCQCSNCVNQVLQSASTNPQLWSDTWVSCLGCRRNLQGCGHLGAPRSPSASSCTSAKRPSRVQQCASNVYQRFPLREPRVVQWHLHSWYAPSAATAPPELTVLPSAPVCGDGTLNDGCGGCSLSASTPAQKG
jgi:hypothetical protein